MLTPKKNLVSLIRATVKPEYQDEVLHLCVERYSAQHLYGNLATISSNYTLHGIPITFTIDRDHFDEDGWNEYPKHKPFKDGVYLIRFNNKAEYLRRWKDDWYDLTGTVKSRFLCNDSIEFKWFGEELEK